MRQKLGLLRKDFNIDVSTGAKGERGGEKDSAPPKRDTDF